VPRWLRVWAVLTACAALPLVTLGAEVTTKRVGLADPAGFRLPWRLFDSAGGPIPLGLLIEHGHRLAGFVVGVACIVLAVALTVQARGWLHRSLGWLALAAVGLQGMLGIFRVDLHALFGPYLALIHACCAQLVFATLVAVAVLCSRAWSQGPAAPAALRSASRWLCLLVFTQIVFGAVLRHLLDPVAQRLHVLLAFAVVVAALLLVRRLMAEDVGSGTRRIGTVLAALLVLQPILGVEAWVRRFGSGELPELLPSSPAADLVRSGHHVLGTLIFATTVALTVLLHRRGAVRAATLPVVPSTRMEGAA
jgi:cytochrome c oxidase assembly protein subunit 15